MLAYRFQSKIPDSGIIKLPEEILNQLGNCSVEIVIFNSEEKGKISFDAIKSLRGKYKGALSSTDEFSKRKAFEKELDF